MCCVECRSYNLVTISSIQGREPSLADCTCSSSPLPGQINEISSNEELARKYPAPNEDQWKK